ncbi:hypothetical protein [Chitinophaga sp. Cy-1792]|uniref:hypothetical protein n=1 Tax=Chitinophaga sp. Cy-1792 TaxID=2608339 RepID=UPI0014222BE0|nr:hypothetical protein [Chitinophaga sp. Cy-1792]NIG52795.1 hypothetical protein [Chitinophaga sp. Cy-1792]
MKIQQCSWPCIFVFALAACASPQQNNSVITDTVPPKTHIFPDKIDTAAAGKLAKDALSWYKQHYDTVAGISLVRMSDTLLPYRIDYGGVDRYIKIFKSSGYFSEKYFYDLHKYFKDCDSRFQERKQLDGPPEGLDYDLVLKSQEIDSEMEDLKNVGVVNYKPMANDHGIMVKLSNGLCFRVVQANGKMLIDSIYRESK